MTESSGDFIEMSLPLDGEAAEAVCALFERHGGGAVVETRLTGPTDGADLPEPENWVRTYIPAYDVEARARVEVGLWHLSQIYPVPEASVRRLSEANWAEAWKAHFTPQRIGERFVIVPSWTEADTDPGDRVIRLDPGMAFGTGLHPTTRLCLAEIESRVRPGSSVLDVGTGSGILAIGASQMGAARVVGIDISPTAIETAAANAATNGVSVELVAGDLSAGPAERYDLVVANLLASTILELADDLAASVGDGGVLIASGILTEQEASVSERLAAAGFEAVEGRVSGDWVALVAAGLHVGSSMP